MSFFQLFQILFATHFVLGVYWALRLWWGIFSAFVITQPEASARDVFTGFAVSFLTLLWYFVWYGSIQFALRGRFPIVSVRGFPVVLGLVYLGLGMHAFAENSRPINVSIIENQEYFFFLVIMLLLSACGFVFLPKLKIQADIEDERLVQERDRRLDEMYPWVDTRPRSPKTNHDEQSDGHQAADRPL